MELLALVAIAGFSLTQVRFQAGSAGFAVLTTVGGMIAFLYAASLVDQLQFGAWLLLVIGVLLACYCASGMISARQTMPVPVGMLLILGFVYWIVHSESALFYYDEYSHWGVFVKEMIAFDRLWNADTNALHPRYLPGASLWQYFFAMHAQHEEGAAFLAQFTLLMAPLMVLWDKIGWRNLLGHATTIILLVVLLFNFGHGFTSLYVDHILGSWFAGTLLNFLVDEKRGEATRLCLYAIPLSVLVLVKTTGVFFALAAAGVIALALLIFEPTKSRRSIGWRWARSSIFSLGVLLLCICLTSLWNINRDNLDVPAGGGEATSLVNGIISQRTNLDDEQDAELTRRFVHVIFNQQISKDEVSAQYNAFSYPVMPAYQDSFRLTTVSLLGISLIAILLQWRYLVAARERNRWATITGCVWLICVLYIIGLYLGYRYTSTGDYGLLLSSYIRYAHSMLLPVAILSCVPLFGLVPSVPYPRLALSEEFAVERKTGILIAVLIAFFLFETPYLRSLFSRQPPHDFRAQTEVVTDGVRQLTGKGSIWVFFPNDVSNGVLGHMLQYQLTPGRVHVEESADRVIAAPHDLRQELLNWDYLWFADRRPALREVSEMLVGQELSDDGLYRIRKSESGAWFEDILN